MTQKNHTSTTHKETFHHIELSLPLIGPTKVGTVFLRQESDGNWFGSAAFCSPNDEFSKNIGRSKSRRRYFQGGPAVRVPVNGKTYSDAMQVFKKVGHEIFGPNYFGGVVGF